MNLERQGGGSLGDVPEERGAPISNKPREGHEGCKGKIRDLPLNGSEDVDYTVLFETVDPRLLREDWEKIYA